MLPFEALLGGITGLFGSAITSVVNFKMKKIEIEQKKLDDEFQLQRIKAESDAMIQENKAGIELISTEYAGKEALADADIYREGQKGLANKNSDKIYDMIDTLLKATGKFSVMLKLIGTFLSLILGIIEVTRKGIRPGLTIFYTIASIYICYICVNTLQTTGEVISMERLYVIIDQYTRAVIYLTISISTFWFSDRSMNKFLQTELKAKK